MALAAVVAVATVWAGGRDAATVSGAQATTTSVVFEAIPGPAPAPVPIPLPDIPLPPGVPASPPGGGEVLNVHSQVVPFTPGLTSWTTSGVVAITLRIDKAAPRVGDAVTFEVVVATAGLACCGVLVRPGDDASFEGGGGLACLPSAAAGTTTATFRWVHVYERSGRFTLSVIARAGTCSEAAGTGGLTGIIEVT
ncbi:MAG TPA: hypothetical protein VFK43_19720 [Acidimicrobiales bacterium]|nr:hypothetical protein [Acidimicrobiales bacterium]